MASAFLVRRFGAILYLLMGLQSDQFGDEQTAADDLEIDLKY